MDIHALPFSKLDILIRVKPRYYINRPLTLGERLRNKRLLLGWKQLESAKFLGVCEDTITGWENNRFIPSFRYKRRINDFFKLDYGSMEKAISFEIEKK